MPNVVYAEWDEEDAVDERPVRSRRVRRPLPWLRLLLLSSVMIAGLAYLAQHRPPVDAPAGPGSVPASVLIAPAPLWQAVPSTPPLYAFEKATAPVAMEARQHIGGGREDTLALGRSGQAPSARVTLVQGSPEPARSFFVDIVRRAADAGLSVSRTAQSRIVASKFGPVEAAAVTLAGAAEQACQAFRFSEPDGGFGFQGWLCGTGARSMDDAQLACFIDGIALVGGNNPSLKAVFARAERNRTEACASDARTASIGSKPLARP